MSQKTGPLRLTVHIFETREPICAKCRFVMNVFVNFIFINILTQNDATWQHITRFS